MNYLGKLFVAAILTGLTAGASAHNYSDLYIFGDSFSDPGNIALAIGTDPDQVITDNGYMPGKPYACAQFTDGDAWATAFANAIGLAYRFVAIYDFAELFLAQSLVPAIPR